MYLGLKVTQCTFASRVLPEFGTLGATVSWSPLVRCILLVLGATASWVLAVVSILVCKLCLGLWGACSTLHHVPAARRGGCERSLAYPLLSPRSHGTGSVGVPTFGILHWRTRLTTTYRIRIPSWKLHKGMEAQQIKALCSKFVKWTR